MIPGADMKILRFSILQDARPTQMLPLRMLEDARSAVKSWVLVCGAILWAGAALPWPFRGTGMRSGGGGEDLGCTIVGASMWIHGGPP